MEGGKLVRLVQRCLSDVARHPVDHVDVYLQDDDVCSWLVALHYPASSPFIGGPGASLTASDFSLYCLLHFDESFPAKPPRLKFLSPWINHQHLWGNRICHSLLSDDFMDFFRERQTHGTSLWNAACALSDGEGIGGMPRYLAVLREFLASDPDYEEEAHVRYDAASLQEDVAAQRRFKPEGLVACNRLECELQGADADGAEEEAPAQEEEWGTDFFTKTPLVPGQKDVHPCFDVALLQGRVPSLSTTMTCLCKRSFDQGARTTDFGTGIAVLLPFPCSQQAWASAGSSLAASALEELTPVFQGICRQQLSRLGAEAATHEVILGVVGEIWKTTCIGIVKDQGYESERAMMCFITLHFLLLCLAEEHPGLRPHAVKSVEELMAFIEEDPPRNLKGHVPDLGRFLVRFLLTEGEAPLRSNAKTVVRELFRRNVRWVRRDLWATEDASDEQQQEQVAASFEASQFGMKLTVFQSWYILRSAELGLNTLAALEACRGKPAPDVLRSFQTDCRGVKEMGTYAEFFLWLSLEELVEQDVHAMLVDAVDEAEEAGYNEGLPPM